MSDAEFKDNLYKFGGIDAAKGTIYLRGNMRMLGNGSYMSQLTVKDMVVTGNAVIPGISFDSLTVAGNVVSTDGNFIGNGALMTGVISTPPPEANIDISGNVAGTYANVGQITAITGNIGNVRLARGNMSVSGQVNVRGNAVAGYFVGNGARLVNVKVSGTQSIDIIGNARGEYADVGDITATVGTVGGVLMADNNVTTSGQVDVLGNVVGGYLIGNGALLKGILTKLPPIANVNILGNVIGTYVNVDQITASVGNIGNVRMAGGNVNVSGQVHALGNMTAEYFVGNGMLLTNVSLQPIAYTDIRGNITGEYANVDKFTAIAGDIGNVRLAGGNVSVSGQVNVLGNVTADYFVGNGELLTGVILGGIQSIDIQGNMIGTYANMVDIKANSGNVGGVRMGNGNVTTSGQVDVLGNVVAGYFFGSGAFLTNVGLPPTANSDIRGNVIGTYARVDDVRASSGNVGNVIIENADVSVSGNTIVRGNVSATYFIGNGALLDALNASGNTRVNGQVNVRGNVMGGNFIGNGSLLYDVVAVGTPPIANIDILGNVDGTYLDVAQIVAISGNIGNVILENGNLTARRQVNVTGHMTAEYFIGDGTLLANVQASGVQYINIEGNVIGNYVDVGQIMATSGNIGNVIMKNGNLTASGQVNVLGNVTADYFVGNGARLTGINRPSMYLSAAIQEDTYPPKNESWGNSIVIKMSVLQSQGIVYSEDSGKFMLEGGVTYRITAQLMWKVPTSNRLYFPYKIVNARTGAQVGTAAEALGQDNSGGNTPGTLLSTLFTPRDTDEFVLQSGPNSSYSVTDAYIPGGIGAYLNIVALGSGFSTGFPTTSNVDITGNIEGSNITVDSVTAKVVGNIGNVRMSGGNIVATGQVNVRGNVVADYFFGNGVLLTNVSVFGIQTINIKGNVDGEYANVANVVATRGNVGNVVLVGSNVFIYGQVNVLGNVTANCFIGGGELVENSKLSGIRSVDILGNVRNGNNANGLTITASVGIIAGVRMENGNITVPGQVNVLGNVTAIRFFGNGSLLKNVRIDDIQVIDIQGNVDSGAYITVKVAEALVGNIGNVTFRQRSNVIATSGNIGNVIMSGGNIDIPGRLNTHANVKAFAFIGDGFNMTGVNITTPVSNTDIIYGNVTGNYANTANIHATFGNIGNVVMESGNVVANNANIGQVFFSQGNVVIGRGGRELNVLGDLRANVFIGNAILTGPYVPSTGNVTINTRGNVLGIYANTDYVNANVAGNVGNVVLESGNITATAGNIGNVLLQSGNITATVGNIGNVRMMAGNVTVSGQIQAGGNVFAYGNIKGNGRYLINSNPFAFKYPTYSDTTVTGNLLGNMANVQSAMGIFGNIGNVRLISGTIDVEGQVTVRGNVVAATILPRTDIRATFGNVGGIIMSGGNMSVAANVHVLGNVTARCFYGDGSQLIDVPLNSYASLISTNSFIVTGVGYVFKMNQEYLNKNIQYTPSTGAYRLQANVPYRITAQFGMTFNPDPYNAFRIIGVRLYTSTAYGAPNIIRSENGGGEDIAAPILDVIVVPPVTADYFLKVEGGDAFAINPTLYTPTSFVNVVSLTGSRVNPI
jgi:hypothetical protein